MFSVGILLIVEMLQHAAISRPRPDLTDKHITVHEERNDVQTKSTGIANDTSRDQDILLICQTLYRWTEVTTGSVFSSRFT